MKLLIESNDLDCTLRQELATYPDAEMVLQHVRNCCDELDPFVAIQRVDGVLDRYGRIPQDPKERGKFLGEIVRAAFGLAITPKVPS